MTVRLVGSRWGSELAQSHADYPDELLVVCPFITRGALKQLVGYSVPSRLRVVTRFDLQAFACGVSDVVALQNVLSMGGEVRGVRGLHAKVFIFEDAVAAVTSANLTNGGMYRNREFGCISAEMPFVTACRDYFEELWRRSGASVSAQSLAEWKETIDQVRVTGARPSNLEGLPDHGVDISGEAPADTALRIPEFDDPASSWVDGAGQGWVKFFGQGDNRAPRSTPVLEEVERAGCHWSCTYPRPVRRVKDGDLLYMARLVEHPNDALIFGRGLGLAHVAGRDEASPDAIERRAWRQHWRYYVRIYEREFLAGSLDNGVSLSELMDDLGTDAFNSTQRNAAHGTGNINPRKALMQQPDVRLTRQAEAWLRQRFDEQLAYHGRLPQVSLDQLDWPAVDEHITRT
jgi:hypothetical protein